MFRKQSSQKGFTLTELMITMLIVLFITMVIYTFIFQNQRIHFIEGRKGDMTQRARVLETLLADNIRSSGSVLSLMHTPTFLDGDSPFNGIYPLNNADFPDGIILAAGDPGAITTLTASFSAGAGTIMVKTVSDPLNSKAMWAKGDVGAVLKPKGYYVFRVTDDVLVGATQLTIRATPVYYSGLLNTANYVDFSADGAHLGESGITNPYPADSPVLRLEYFNIYLVSESNGRRILTITTDTEGQGDVLGNPSNQRAVPLVEDIEDIQFEYITTDDPAEFWASNRTQNRFGTACVSWADPCASVADANCTEFISRFINRNIAAVNVYVLFKTEREEFQMGNAGAYSKPRMGDMAATSLPPDKHHYAYMQYEINLRNYSIVY